MDNFQEKPIKSEKKSDWLSSFKKNVTSQFGEDGIIEKVFEIIKEGDKWCVEFGAWDGKTSSNTWNLIVNKGWSAVFIESDIKRYKELLTTYKDYGRVVCVNKLVNFEGSNTLDNIFSATLIPKSFDLLCIDIDGSDYFIWDSLKLYRPKVVVIEFNPSIPIDVDFVQPKNLNVNQGSSLLSLVKLGKNKGYELIAATSTNAFFVDKKYFKLFEIKDNSPSLIYKERKHQAQLFQLYDGTLVLSGCKRLLWHGIEITQKDIQVLPWFLRKFPDRENIILFRLYKYIWRRIFRSDKLLLFKTLGQYLQPISLNIINTKIFFIGKVKKIIKKTPFYGPICGLSQIMAQRKEMRTWEKGDRSGSPPHLVKQKIVKEYVRRFATDTLIETGTYLGEMVGATRDNFKEIFSIELDDKLFKKAKEKFANWPHIHIIHGNSGKVLPEILTSIKKPCLFWLDAHYSRGITAKGDLETPIEEELREIFNHPVKNHVILIDDAHCFIGKNDYPTMRWLKDYVLKYRPGWILEIENDIIRIHPPK